MEIVIKISDEDYKAIAKGYLPYGAIADAIKDGTPLPEHHGDLVDRSCICKAIYASEDNLTGSEMTYDEMDIYNDGIDSMWDKLQNANPVIKADTRRDEE